MSALFSQEVLYSKKTRQNNRSSSHTLTSLYLHNLGTKKERKIEKKQQQNENKIYVKHTQTILFPYKYHTDYAEK